MSDNGDGRTKLEEIEAELWQQFPGPEDMHRLMIHVAARDELYHCAVERMADEVIRLKGRITRIETECHVTNPLCDAE